MIKIAHITFIALGLVFLGQFTIQAQVLPSTTNPIEFAADKVVYDQKTAVITASGNVVLHQNGNRLNAQTVIFYVNSGEVNEYFSPE